MQIKTRPRKPIHGKNKGSKRGEKILKKNKGQEKKTKQKKEKKASLSSEF